MIIDMRSDSATNDVAVAGGHDRIGGYPAENDGDWPAEPLPWTDVAEPEAPRRGWLAPALAGIASLAWLGGMLWLARDQLPFLLPVDLVQFVAALAVVPVLIGVVYLLAMRTSRREARRFGATAAAMRASSMNSSKKSPMR